MIKFYATGYGLHSPNNLDINDLRKPNISLKLKSDAMSGLFFFLYGAEAWTQKINTMRKFEPSTFGKPDMPHEKEEEEKENPQRS